ncbi:hypothetical protein CPB84DRAFT_614109 [Gymnopilus junonius]|uniref:Uncharacterized protein n=1 Tax=Gymnopilus junonius TaxID=109634 RepID=A0A9P5NUQ0_GYMJU|nr:hypothetical protein CPB84DRAFT_614109 [Gymnopilus junonius]
MLLFSRRFVDIHCLNLVEISIYGSAAKASHQSNPRSSGQYPIPLSLFHFLLLSTDPGFMLFRFPIFRFIYLFTILDVGPVMSMIHLFFTLFAILLLITYHAFIIISRLIFFLLSNPTALTFLASLIYLLFPTMRLVLPVLRRLYITYRSAFLISFRILKFFHRIILALATYCFFIARQRLVMDCLILGLKGAFLVYSQRFAISSPAPSLIAARRILSHSLANFVRQPQQICLTS